MREIFMSGSMSGGKLSRQCAFVGDVRQKVRSASIKPAIVMVVTASALHLPAQIIF
jgi:hypothetical protein